MGEFLDWWVPLISPTSYAQLFEPISCKTDCQNNVMGASQADSSDFEKHTHLYCHIYIYYYGVTGCSVYLNKALRIVNENVQDLLFKKGKIG